MAEIPKQDFSPELLISHIEGVIQQNSQAFPIKISTSWFGNKIREDLDELRQSSQEKFLKDCNTLADIYGDDFATLDFSDKFQALHHLMIASSASQNKLMVHLKEDAMKHYSLYERIDGREPYNKTRLDAWAKFSKAYHAFKEVEDHQFPRLRPRNLLFLPSLNEFPEITSALQLSNKEEWNLHNSYIQAAFAQIIGIFPADCQTWDDFFYATQDVHPVDIPKSDFSPDYRELDKLISNNPDKIFGMRCKPEDAPYAYIAKSAEVIRNLPTKFNNIKAGMRFKGITCRDSMRLLIEDGTVTPLMWLEIPSEMLIQNQ